MNPPKSPATPTVAPRVLGLVTLTALVTGNQVGSGIFLLPAALASIGSISLLGWILTALGAMVLATIFARLGFLVPQTGGSYQFCHHAYGGFIAFQMAFCYWIQTWIGNAAIVLGLIGYLSVFWPILTAVPVYTFGAAAGVIWFLTGINLIGMREAGWLQVATTILKLLPLLLVMIFGFSHMNWSNLDQFNLSGNSNFTALKDAATLTLWSFIGLEAATIPAGAVKDPQKNIPRATLLGTCITATFYIGSTLVLFGLMPLTSLAHSTAPYADAATQLFGSCGGKMIAIGAAISCFGALNGWILIQAQVPLAAARDDLFPNVFTKLTKRGTPKYGLIISSALVTGLLALNLKQSLVHQFTFAILLATLASLIPYIFTVMAYLLLARTREEQLSSLLRVTLGVLACIGFVYGYFAISGAALDTVFYGMMLLFISLPLYAWLAWRHEQRDRKRREAHV